MKQLQFYINKNSSSDKLIAEARTNHYSGRELGYVEVLGGYILPSRTWKDVVIEGGVVDADKIYMSTSACYEGGSCSYSFSEDYVENDRECIFLGFFLLCYGHAITDAFRKVWFLRSEKGRSLVEQGVDIVYVSSPNSKMPAWHLRLLELGGVDTESLKHISSITKYKKIIIPDNCLYDENGSLFYTSEFKNILNNVKSSIHVQPNTQVYSKLYLTRKSLELGRRERGEEDLEEIFQRNGYKILSPEKFSVDEQIWMLMHCEKFASTECSCSHQAIFCNESAEVVLLKKADYINQYSSMIADLVGCKTVYIKAHHTIKIHRNGHMWGPFYLCVTPQLRKYLKEKGVYRPYWLRKSYWGYIVYVISLIIKRILYHLGIH